MRTLVGLRAAAAAIGARLTTARARDLSGQSARLVTVTVDAPAGNVWAALGDSHSLVVTYLPTAKGEDGPAAAFDSLAEDIGAGLIPCPDYPDCDVC